MNELLSLYTELLRGATDEQIPQHLTNLVQDAAALTEAVKKVIDDARARVQAAQGS